MRTPLNLPRLAVAALAALLVAACSSSPGKGDRPENPFKTAAESPGGPQSPLSDRELRQQAAQLYRRAREALDNTDYTVAIQRYDALIARYPFSDYSTQAEMEKIYAQYKAFQADEAVAAADRFLRAHPRNVYADYVMYLKGVTDFERDNGLLDEVMPSTAKRDIGNQRRAFEDFAALLQRYPKSRYAGDARRRMLYSRNRIADHELSVAQFYVTRGAYVAAAKRLVFGRVGIDSIAGPSEIVVVCDGRTDPDWIAMDLFSQAEHDELAQSVLISPDRAFLDRVLEAMRRRIAQLPRAAIVRESLAGRGAFIAVRDLEQAIEVSNRIAPEHLELSVEQPRHWLERVRHAGAVFLGRHTPEAFGDYCAGPNHVLPTSRAARFSNPLGVYEFQKRTSLIECSPEGARSLAAVAGPIADAEGLQAHAASARDRG